MFLNNRITYSIIYSKVRKKKSKKKTCNVADFVLLGLQSIPAKLWKETIAKETIINLHKKYTNCWSKCLICAIKESITCNFYLT